MKTRAARPRPAPSRPPANTAPLPPGRKWLFRITAMLLPVLALGLVELVLRVAGCGYSTGFFKEAEYDGRPFLLDNEKFSLRFFPPELARWPTPIRIPAEKPAGVCRVFVFGESAAMGDPQPAYGAARYLEVLLRERFPGRKFEIVNTAFTAINSHVILPIARDCASCDGDIWIVYVGNNEMVGPFGAATVFGTQAPPLPMVRLNLALQKARLGQSAVSALRRLRGKPATLAWEGMRMFLQNQVPPDDPRRAAVYQNFEANLRDILRAGLDSGAKVLLSTVSVNLRDCPPFGSLANSNLPPADLAQFQVLYAEAVALEKLGNDFEATRKFEEAAQLDDQFAELQYRWADCLWRTGNAVAQSHYQLACDADALPFRADTEINGIIRRVGREFASRRLILSDAESQLAGASPLGISGQEIFFEHVHFNFRGNYLLGRLWAEQVAQLLPESVRKSAAADWASQETCERNLGLTLWNRGFVLDLVVARLQRPPLDAQFNNPARLAALQADLKTLRLQQADTNAIYRNGEDLLRAIQRAPQDHWLHEGLASLYEALGDLNRAVSAYRKVHELLPHDFYSNLQLGRFLSKIGQPAEGESLLRLAARLRPSIPDAWVELGHACMAQRKYTPALEAFECAAELRPREASYASSVALALTRLNRRTEAISAYRRAIQLNPELWLPHFELATELAADQQLEEAAGHYAEAIRLNPRHAVSRINLGVVRFRQNRLGEAITHFEAALLLDPTNAAAADYLRQVTARRNPQP